ncbi:MAG: hypothetical protein Q4B80_04145 [Aerococcaceae bacterium]|nr:hypothetical protein [Aerococcaceae bacterium]
MAQRANQFVQPQVEARHRFSQVAVPTATPKVKTKTTRKARTVALTSYEWMVMVLTVFLGVGMIFWRMNIQIKTTEYQYATKSYESQTSKLQAQTDIMLGEIANQNNYAIIQQVAQQEGMTINAANIKEVDDATTNE